MYEGRTAAQAGIIFGHENMSVVKVLILYIHRLTLHLLITGVS